MEEEPRKKPLNEMMDHSLQELIKEAEANNDLETIENILIMIRERAHDTDENDTIRDDDRDTYNAAYEAVMRMRSGK